MVYIGQGPEAELSCHYCKMLKSVWTVHTSDIWEVSRRVNSQLACVSCHRCDTHCRVVVFLDFDIFACEDGRRHSGRSVDDLKRTYAHDTYY